ncbi:MAG: single-stranded-DNA-specific exonuclease RecJ [Christensenellaceae bacterium]|nr:single-stranded-DNA-specific exonuclease RecJ [Christensenellaceae bacterium]
MIIYEKSKYFSAETDGDNRLGLSPLLIRALRARGAVTDDEINRFLNPSPAFFHDPYMLPDMEKAVSRIRSAISIGEKICVFGDYDVDGICATSMLVDFFRSIGADVCYYIPSRRDEGYGMSRSAVERLKQCGVELVITVDNGISASCEVQYCIECGIDVIVTDHHIPPETLPVCTAVVCHTVPGSNYPNRILCGAGVAFKLLHALAGLDTAMRYVALAGLASVADVVPLLDENRILVKLGLEAVNAGDCCVGLRRLIASIPTAKMPYTVCNLGFSVAPRLNASGRMSDASLAVELFLSADIERIDEIIAELNRLNECRQQQEAEILNSAIEMVSHINLAETRAIILKSADWNSGVIGIAASRISEMYHRPAILFSESDGVLKGSARSIDGINIHDALTFTKELFLRFGGHAKAAGVTIESSHFEAFVEEFNRHLADVYDDKLFVPRKSYEFDIALSGITHELVKEISLLAPFGEGNPSPIFHASEVRISHLRRFGCNAQHMRMDVRDGFRCLEAVWFASASSFDRLMNADTTEMLFTLSINNWNGQSNLQLRLLSAKAELPSEPSEYVEKSMARFCSALIENCALSECVSEYSCDESTACSAPQSIEVCLDEISNHCISGMMILVFTIDGAKRIIADMRERDIGNIEICFGLIPDSPVHTNTVVIAPIISALPENGFNQILFYDLPPTPEVYSLVAQRFLNKSKSRSNEEPRISNKTRFFINFDARGEFGQVACLFDCRREFMVCCYRRTLSMLSLRCYSFEELSARLSEEMQVPLYQVEFALRVFFELDFIAFNRNGSISTVENVRCTALTNSALYRRISKLQNYTK